LFLLRCAVLRLVREFAVIRCRLAAGILGAYQFGRIGRQMRQKKVTLGKKA
jgi:hypothetical protein